MNVAVIFAGGVGRRMNNSSTPKQFLNLHNKPIIIYTLEAFQNCPEVDGICISCLPSHMEYMERLCRKYEITKANWIVAGGSTGQESIFNGLEAIHAHCPEDTVVMIHDGVRPLISSKLICDNIACVRKNGNAISCTSMIETPAQIAVDGTITAVYDRKNTVIAKAPQSFFLRDIYRAHLQARQEGRDDFVDSASMLTHYGATLHMVECPWDNIKITTPGDFYIFKAIVEARENAQIFGI